MLRTRALSLVALVLVFSATLFGATKPNVVLITLDSFPADRIGSKTGFGEVGQSSLAFEQAYAQAPLTVVSHATIFTGTYPQTHKVTQFAAPLASSLPFLPDIFHAQGYRTGAFVGTLELDPRNGLAPGFDRGFDRYDAGFRQPQAGQSRFQTVQRRGATVVARATAWLGQNQNGPFFLWVELHDAHAGTKAAFNVGISASARAASNLITYLREQKLYDNTLIVIVADHGESLGAHGEQTHGMFLYDETVHVPLLLKLPGPQTAGKHVKSRVGLVDVAPTILEIAGMPVPPQMQGQSLLRAAKGGADQPAYSRTDFPQRGFGWSALQSWRAGKYLYIRAPQPELYDLSTDPGATRNLAQKSKAILDTLASQLASFDQRLTQQGGATPGLSSSEVQKLASLGYVGLQKSSAAAGAAATGTDPKDEISTANKVLSAVALWEDGKPERVVPVIQALGRDAANIYLAQFVMGAALDDLRQCSKAIEPLHKAIELQPDSAWAHYYMGSCLLQNGDFKSAAVHLEIVSSHLPEFAEGHRLLAQAYEHLGRAAEANSERKKADSTP